jgi:hypothetical protein
MGKVIRNLEATTRPGRNNALNGAAWTRADGLPLAHEQRGGGLGDLQLLVPDWPPTESDWLAPVEGAGRR